MRLKTKGEPMKTKIKTLKKNSDLYKKLNEKGEIFLTIGPYVVINLTNTEIYYSTPHVGEIDQVLDLWIHDEPENNFTAAKLEDWELGKV
jgi:hypothetical protein